MLTQTVCRLHADPPRPAAAGLQPDFRSSARADHLAASWRPGPRSRGRRWPRGFGGQPDADPRRAAPARARGAGHRPPAVEHDGRADRRRPGPRGSVPPHRARVRGRAHHRRSTPRAYDLAARRAAARGHARGPGTTARTSRPSSRSDLGYHRALFRTAGREGLWELVIQRSGNVDRLRNLHLPTARQGARRSSPPTTPILDALKAGDEVEAQRVMRRHLTGTLGTAREIRETHRQFFY